jgi:hypothetical protein
MNRAQRRLITALLIAVALLLPLLLLQWGTQWGTSSGEHALIIFYSTPTPGYPNSTDYWGIYTDGTSSLVGVIFGVIAPMCLLAGAAYLSLAGKKDG